ncbi:MAG: hypothetical protein ABI836_15070 [Gemmatimonadota bacterium]
MLIARRFIVPSVLLTTLVTVFTACTESAITDQARNGPELAGGSLTQVTVTGATPSTAPTDTTVNIGITGSGFDRGSVVIFQVNGIPEPKLKVNSTKYSSSTSLVANVTIAADAPPTTYDVAVTTSKGKKGIGTELFAVSTRITDPTASWLIPLTDAGLGVASDGKNSNGTHSVYANGICGVSGQIFATSAGSNTGDATIQTAKGKNCSRRFLLRYPDGGSESVLSFNNLNVLQSTSYSIPIGSTVKRRLIVAPGSLSNNPSRCGRLLFGPNGTVGPGSDSLLVTRLDSQTWQLQSQAAPDNRAYCENNGQLYAMPVNVTIVSSVPLP